MGLIVLLAFVGGFWWFLYKFIKEARKDGVSFHLVDKYQLDNLRNQGRGDYYDNHVEHHYHVHKYTASPETRKIEIQENVRERVIDLGAEKLPVIWHYRPPDRSQ